VIDLQSARFTALPSTAGHYESYYLKASDPERPRGVWLRHTVFKRPGERPVPSIWLTLWDGEGPPAATKLTLATEDLTSTGAELIRVGTSSIGPSRASGETDAASWELTYVARAPSFPYLPRDWMYSASIPRTKAASLQPLADFSGYVTLGDRRLELDGWPGMLGHNWGSEHAESWIWLHGAGFADAPDAWFDATLGRIRLGRFVAPWVANGCLRLDGRNYRLGGLARMRSVSVHARPDACRFTLPGAGVTVHGEAHAPLDRCVAWRYCDPGAGAHGVTNCSVAALELAVDLKHAKQERVLRAQAGAAYELGAREDPPGIALQPFPDP
jgi:hypothetical protein